MRMPRKKILKKTKVEDKPIVEEPVLEAEIDTKSIPTDLVPVVDRFKEEPAVPKEEIKTEDKLVEDNPVSTQVPEAASSSVVPQETIANESNGNLLWKVVPVLLILLAVGAGVWLYTQGFKKDQNNRATPSPAVQQTQESSAQPTPVQEINLKDYKIKVLNGSGIAGEAAKLKDLLGQEGFTVESTGNADNSDYTKTIVEAGKNVPADAVNKLKEILSKSYSVSNVQELTDTKEASILIIIGSPKSTP